MCTSVIGLLLTIYMCIPFFTVFFLDVCYAVFSLILLISSLYSIKLCICQAVLCFHVVT